MNQKLYYYRVYIRHQYGTDKIIVTTKKRSVALAGNEGLAKARRQRGVAYPSVIDVIPMKYVHGKLVETRRLRKQYGEFRQVRKAKARTSRRQSRRESFAWSA